MTPPLAAVDVRHDAAPRPAPVSGGVPMFLVASAGTSLVTPLSSRQDLGAASPTLRSAVCGFFDNGGRTAYLVPTSSWAPTDCEDALEETDQDELDDVDLVCAPDLVVSDRPHADVVATQRSLLRHCREHGGRFALLDSVAGSRGTAGDDERTAAVRGQAADLAATGDGAAGALLDPWLRVEGGDVPASGHVAGVMARRERADGPHASPANQGIEGALGLGATPSDADAAALGAAGVDCVRVLPGRGVRLWGSRTLDGQSIGTRRVVLAVRRRARTLLEAMAFEPQDTTLERRIVREVEAFLAGLLRRGALRGGDPAGPFAVRCRTAPASDRTAPGRVVVDVALAVAEPAELVTLHLVLEPTGTVTST